MLNNVEYYQIISNIVEFSKNIEYCRKMTNSVKK